MFKACPSLATPLLKHCDISSPTAGSSCLARARRFKGVTCHVLVGRPHVTTRMLMMDVTHYHRLLETFGASYLRDNPLAPFSNSEGIMLLAYSTCMLHTSLHSPNIRNDRRTTIEQFISQNRGLDNGEDLDEMILREIFKDIRSKEMKIPGIVW